MKYLSIVAILFVIFASSNNLHSQDRRSDFNNWSIGLNYGANLFWGDMSDDVSQPFAKYFTKDQAYGASLTLEKRFLPFLSANLRGSFGGITGYRDFWSNDAPANLYFETEYNDFSLNAEIDLLNIFNPKPRLFNFYIKGGVGMVFFKATKMNQLNDVIISTANDNALIVPWGWGVRFDINERIGLSFENTFQHAFSDELDAHASKFTDVNDIYSYTSLGISYRLFVKERKPSIDETPIKTIDTLIAVKEEVKLTPLKINIKGEGNTYPGETYSVRVLIDKGERNENARIQFSIPMNFKAEAIETNGANFNFVDNICSFSWDELPKDPNVHISFDLTISSSADYRTYKIPGILFYYENGEEKTKSVNINLNVEKPVIAEAESVADDNTEKKADNSEQLTKTNETEELPKETTEKVNNLNSDVVFRVQVRAIYGGKSSPQAIAKMYGLDEVIIEDYDNGYMKYLAGEFSTYEEAKAYKEKLRAGKVPGAFVVGYEKDNRISSIQQAIDMQGSSIAPENNNAIDTKGVIYRIQVAAVGKNYSPKQIASLYNLSDKVILIPHNGLNKYLIGNFNNYRDAELKLKEIQSIVAGAFIVKFIDGVRRKLGFNSIDSTGLFDQHYC